MGVDLPIYPGKGYSATFPLLRPEGAPMVSTIDDGKKIAMSRLGNVLRVAGTIELGGFDLSLDSPWPAPAATCCRAALPKFLPGVCDTRTPEEGGNPLGTGRACARHAHQHPLHRPDPRGQAVGECRPRHAGLDARRRLGQGHGRAAERRSAPMNELRLFGVQAPRAVRGTVAA